MNDYKQLLDDVQSQGYEIRTKKSGHLEILPTNERALELARLGWSPPDGGSGRTTVPSTPGKHNRSLENTRANLRKWVGLDAGEAVEHAIPYPKARERREGVLARLQEAGPGGLSGAELVADLRGHYPTGPHRDNLVRVLGDLQWLTRSKRIVRLEHKERRSGSTREVYVWAAAEYVLAPEPAPEEPVAELPEPAPEEAPEPTPEDLETVIDMLFEFPLSVLEQPDCRHQLLRLAPLVAALQ